MAKSKKELKPETIKRLTDIINKHGLSDADTLYRSEAYSSLYNYMNKFEKANVDFIVDKVIEGFEFDEIRIMLKDNENNEEEKDMNTKNETNVVEETKKSLMEEATDAIFMISEQKVVEAEAPVNVTIGDGEDTQHQDVMGKIEDIASKLGIKSEEDFIAKLADSSFIYGLVNVAVEGLSEELNMTDSQRTETFDALSKLVKVIVPAAITTMSKEEVIEKVDGEIVETLPKSTLYRMRKAEIMGSSYSVNNNSNQPEGTKIDMSKSVLSNLNYHIPVSERPKRQSDVIRERRLALIKERYGDKPFTKTVEHEPCVIGVM